MLTLKRKPVVAMLDQIAERVQISYEIVDDGELEVNWQVTNFFGDTYYITAKTYEELKNEKIEVELKVVSDLIKICALKGYCLSMVIVSGHPQICSLEEDSG